LKLKSKCRYAQLGDIIMVNDGHIGMVREIRYDKWGHQENVFVVWQTEPSWCYNPKHGYCGVNVHNLRHVYRIFREGEEIK